MRRTMVVSVFAGCGKTWLTNHQNQYGYSMRDSDSSTYEKTAGWEKEYHEALAAMTEEKLQTQLREFLVEVTGDSKYASFPLRVCEEYIKE